MRIMRKTLALQNKNCRKAPCLCVNLSTKTTALNLKSAGCPKKVKHEKHTFYDSAI